MTYADRTALRERPGRTPLLPDAVALLGSDIPDGMTVDQYRRARADGARRRNALRLRRTRR
jgi:hypothetical protein